MSDEAQRGGISMVGRDSSKRGWKMSLGACAEICIRDGQPTIHFTSDVSESTRRELIEGPLEAVHHLIEGRYAIHGSCVSHCGHAISLMGLSGSGKSTLAATLVRNGLLFVSDGMTLVAPESLQVVPGRRRFKLSDEAIATLGLEGVADYVNDRRRKRYVWLKSVADQSVLPVATLETVFHLVPGESERIEELTPREQLALLASNCYLATQISHAEYDLMLQRAAQMIRAGLRVKRLVRRKGWQHLQATVDLLLRDLHQFAEPTESIIARNANDG